MMAQDLFFNVEQPLVADQVIGVAVEAFERSRLISSDVSVEIIDGEPLIRGELIGDVADKPDGGCELADIEVVGAVEELDVVARSNLIVRLLFVAVLRRL